MHSDATAYIVAAAALAVAMWAYTHTAQLKFDLQNCEAQYQGFREGVIYGK